MDRRVNSWCPAQRSARLPASSRSAAKYGLEASARRRQRRHRHEALHADVGEVGERLQELVQGLRGESLLGVLARDVDLGQAVDRLLAARSRRSAAESVESECTRRTRPARSRALRLCRWPMKSHVKRSRATACLAISCSTRFSPASCSPAADEHGHVLRCHVLDRGQQLDVGRRATRARRGLRDCCSCAAARFSRTTSSSTLTDARSRGRR